MTSPANGAKGASVVVSQHKESFPMNPFYPNPWEDDPLYSSDDWKIEVANDETRLGYIEWVLHKKEAEAEV